MLLPHVHLERDRGETMLPPHICLALCHRTKETMLIMIFCLFTEEAYIQFLVFMLSLGLSQLCFKICLLGFLAMPQVLPFYAPNFIHYAPNFTHYAPKFSQYARCLYPFFLMLPFLTLPR